MANLPPDEADAAPKAAGKTGSTRRKATVNAIETANKKSNDEFLRDYVRPSGTWPEWVHPVTRDKYALSLSRPADLSAGDLDACFDLVHETSGDDYRRSSAGWHPAAKKREMASPDLRYVLVRDGDGRVVGFASMMATFEHGEPVVYCYEIHLAVSLQGTGLGSLLIGHVARAAENMASVDKVMLTCFVRNARARAFYRKLGFDVDVSSPRERTLRGGRAVASDYVILSRRTARHGSLVD